MKKEKQIEDQKIEEGLIVDDVFDKNLKLEKVDDFFLSPDEQIELNSTQ